MGEGVLGLTAACYSRAQCEDLGLLNGSPFNTGYFASLENKLESSFFLFLSTSILCSQENKLENNFVFLFAFRFERIPLKLHGNIFVLQYKNCNSVAGLAEILLKVVLFLLISKDFDIVLMKHNIFRTAYTVLCKINESII